MLTEERYAYILNELNKKQLIHLQEIAQTLHVSESTVRRDFQNLEEAGELIRVHGGAKRVGQRLIEPNLVQKREQYPSEKKRIAKRASELIVKNDTIFLDAGTTTREMIPYLPRENILVVTHGIEIAYDLYRAQIPTLLIGGLVKERTGAILGTTTYEQIKSLNFDRAFMGMNGIDQKAGYTTPDIEEARIKKLVFENSRYTYVLADSSKFKAISFCQVAALDQAILITDQKDKDFDEWMTIMEVSE